MEAAGWIKKCVEEPSSHAGHLCDQIVAKCAVYDRTIPTIG